MLTFADDELLHKLGFLGEHCHEIALNLENVVFTFYLIFNKLLHN